MIASLTNATSSVTTFGASTIANWYYANAPDEYYLAAAQTSVSTVSTWQESVSTGYPKEKEEYFGLIKTGFGQFTYDQLLQEFLSTSTIYTDSLLLNEWHLYGSSRLGIRKANIEMASLKFDANIDGSGNFEDVTLSTAVYPVHHW